MLDSLFVCSIFSGMAILCQSSCLQSLRSHDVFQSLVYLALLGAVIPQNLILLGINDIFGEKEEEKCLLIKSASASSTF